MTNTELLHDLAARVAHLERAITQRQTSARRKPTQPKTCTECGATFNRHRYTNGRLERNKAYENRDTCGRATCRVALGNRVKAQRRPQPPTQHCQVCAHPIRRGPTESATAYAERKVCSDPHCNRIIRSGPKPPRTKRPPTTKRTPNSAPRPCDHCHAPIRQRPNESRQNYAKRRTCLKPECVTALRIPNRWTPAEEAIVISTYPSGGREGARQALARAGFDRSVDSIIACVERLKLYRAKNAPRGATANTSDTGQATDKVLHVLADYGGLPLGLEDVVEESSLSRSATHRALTRLVEAGRVGQKPDPDSGRRVLFYALDQAAA